MSDVAAATPAKATKKGASKAKKQPKPTHPPYKTMIMAAIKSLKERNGSSRQAILKYITSHYKVGDQKKAGTRLRIALKKAVAAGDIKQMKGSGASGSFRLAKEEKPSTKKSPKKAAKKVAAKPKKPVAKKASKPKKPAAKKATTPKKPAPKKSPKKPVAKKTPKRPAPRRTPKKAAAKKK